MSITNYFKYFSAPLKNSRWSWGGVRETDKSVFLRVWQDESKKFNDDRFQRLTYNKKFEFDQDNLGYTERLQHIELIKNGYQCYLVMCKAKDTNQSPRDIESFNKENIFVGDGLVILDGDFFIKIVDSKKKKDIKL